MMRFMGRKAQDAVTAAKAEVSRLRTCLETIYAARDGDLALRDDLQLRVERLEGGMRALLTAIDVSADAARCWWGTDEYERARQLVDHARG